MNKFTGLLLVIVAAGLGLAGGYQLAEQASPSIKAEAVSTEPEVLFWRNPMNPAITSPVFTQDDMGMDYLPVYAGTNASPDTVGTVIIDPVVVQNIGVRTAPVEQRGLSRQLTAVGHVDFDEERLASLHPKTTGWVEKLMVDQTGVALSRDAMLLEIYSPDLVAAQQEYLIALANWESLTQHPGQMRDNARQVLDSALERLQLYDVPAHQIEELSTARKPMRSLHIHTPFAGRVMNIGVREGQYITPKDELYLIADLSRVWVSVDVYEDDLPWIALGDKAQMRVRAAPGREFHGVVSFIHPVVDRRSRTVDVRLEFDNPDAVLKPGMFANIVLSVDNRPEALVVPSQAIVRSGQREQVFVAIGEGKFEPRDVRLGISAGGLTQLHSGVEVGERVVVSSQFLIDSESKLLEATAKMMAPDASAQAMTDADMDMSNMSMNDLDMNDMSMDDMEMSP